MTNNPVIPAGRRIECFDASREGLRWIVGSANGPRSNTWRLWGNKKGDLYLAVRSLGGVIKASFHRDRRCQVGFTSEYAGIAQQRFGGKSRHWEIWTLPDEPCVRVAQVVIPDSDLAVFQGNESGATVWLPPPSAGHASVVSIFVTERPEAKTWQELIGDAEPIALFEYKSRLAWAVNTTMYLEAKTIQRMDEARQAAIHFPGAAHTPKISSTRSVIWGSSTGTAHDLFFYELSWK